MGACWKCYQHLSGFWGCAGRNIFVVNRNFPSWIIQQADRHCRRRGVLRRKPFVVRGPAFEAHRIICRGLEHARFLIKLLNARGWFADHFTKGVGARQFVAIAA
jgi:hypothetical protein